MIALAAAAASALAGGFAVAQQGAWASGTAHAGVARRDDPALAWANPAGLADDGGARMALGAVVALSRTEARATDGAWAANSSTPPATPPHLYASHAWTNWALGLAVNAPHGGSVRWPADWALRTTAVASASSYLRVSPFVARRFGALALAVGPHVDVGRLAVARRTDHVTTEGWARIRVAGAGVGVDASARWQIVEPLAVAIVYKSRTQTALRGWADFDVPDVVSSTLPDQRVTTRVVLPDRLVVGATLEAAPVTVHADAEWLAWSVNRDLVLDFADPATPDTVQDNRWRNALAVRAGLEGAVGSVVLRGGLYVDGVPAAPVPRETLSPASPDAMRLGATVGCGVPLASAVRLDVAAEGIAVLSRASLAPGVDATFRTRVAALAVTLSVAP